VLRFLRYVLRALVLRCPSCGGGPLFKHWLKIQPACLRWGLRLEREEGSFSGSFSVNLVVTELVWLGAFAGILIATWPSPPWSLLQWGSVTLMVIFPLLFYPFSKTIWIAIDLGLHPLERHEEGWQQSGDGANENASSRRASH
jgi:uncharacterized protein (DUF983 family)